MTTQTQRDPRAVEGRRRLRLQSLEELLAEAERLAEADVEALGNWSLGQILDHLATWMDFSIDGVPARVPWVLRTVLRPLRHWVLQRPMPTGFRWPADADRRLVPHAPVATEAGLQHLRRAVARQRGETHRAPSPLLGRLTPAEWEQLHLRHAEHHLGFIVPSIREEKRPLGSPELRIETV